MKQPRLEDIKDTPLNIKSFPYPQICGSLQFLASNTHPEIIYSLKIASKYLREWGEPQVKWLKHILRFLRRPQNNKYILSGKHNSMLSAYCDASHLGCPDTRRSVSGYIIKLGTDTIDFNASFQNIIPHSTFESELLALDNVTRRLRHIRWLIESIGGPLQGTIPIYTDSQAVIDMCNNPIISKRTLHIEAKYFRIRQYLKDKLYVLKKVSSEEQQADLLVAYKSKPQFYKLLTAVKGEQPPDEADDAEQEH